MGSSFFWRSRVNNGEESKKEGNQMAQGNEENGDNENEFDEQDGVPMEQTEEQRQVESIRGLLIETINLLWREYHVQNLKFFRLRVEKAETVRELEIAAEMLTTIGRFHEFAGGNIQNSVSVNPHIDSCGNREYSGRSGVRANGSRPVFSRR
jgi:hypothetical protein